MRRWFCLIAAWAFLASASGASLEEVKAALELPGKHHLELSAGGNDVKTVIPLTVITGPKPGATLLALAGV
ncbi:MAG: hypothetical protein AAF552_16630, partial [Pseudomonadota bacterium]